MENRYVLDQERYAACARKAAADGAVLLRNERQALPLRQGERVAVFGRAQLHYYKSGTGSGGLVNTRYVWSILDALKAEKELTVDPELEQTYRAWDAAHPVAGEGGWGREAWNCEEMPLPDDAVERAAGKNSAALVLIGRTAGEDRDAADAEGSYQLTQAERDMLQKVCARFERTAVLLNTGGIMDMRWVEEYRPAAVMYVWQGGMEGGRAVADLLTGRVCPTGKLADTIARAIQDYPSDRNFGGEEANVYAEDIYVGYRWFATFAKDRVLYPFGFGLSYTNFAVVCRSCMAGGNSVRLRVEVRNTGNCTGRETVQVYSRPAQGRLGRPRRELVSFHKTSPMAPGESLLLTFEIPYSALAAYDDSGASGYPFCYVLEAGRYKIYVGTDARSASLAGTFDLPETRVIRAMRQACAPVTPFERVRPRRNPDGTMTPVLEPVPLRRYDPDQRIRDEMPDTIPCAGDRGIRLADVLDGKSRMEDFLAQLTDDDLCCLVRGEGMCSPKVTPGTASAFGGVTDRLRGFGIPCGCCADGPSGIRMDCGAYAFSLPSGTCLACTFDEALLEELFSFLGAELRKNRVDTILGPGMNIHRHPLNGRNFEYFSEDPYLTGKMAAAELRGLHRCGVTGTIKHFAANNQEYHRRDIDSVVSERALREIYLKGFEIAVREAGAYSVMTTYGGLNGIWTAGNYDLVTTILRKEWGFEGMVMTDWWAAMNDEGEKPTMRNTAAMVRAQNDLYMVVSDSAANSAGDNLAQSLADGTLTRGQLQRCARHILYALMRSPAMPRLLNRLSPEELAAERQDAEEQTPFENIPYFDIENELALDVSAMKTGKGDVNVYGLRIARPGYYDLTLRLRVDAEALAQVPVTVFSNGKLMGTHTFTGEGAPEREFTQDLGIFANPNNFVRLYFAQSGITPVSLVIRFRKPLQLSWE